MCSGWPHLLCPCCETSELTNIKNSISLCTGSTETCDGMIQNQKCKNCLFACVSWSRITTLPVHSCLKGQVSQGRRQSSKMTCPTWWARYSLNRVSSIRVMGGTWVQIHLCWNTELCILFCVYIQCCVHISHLSPDHSWVAYQEPNYRGAHYTLEKKDYNNFSDWGAQSSTIGSIRRVRFS